MSLLQASPAELGQIECIAGVPQGSSSLFLDLHFDDPTAVQKGSARVGFSNADLMCRGSKIENTICVGIWDYPQAIAKVTFKRELDGALWGRG